MNAFVYGNPTEILYGRGKLAEVGAAAKRFGTRALIVTTAAGGSSEASYLRTCEYLRQAGVEFTRFDGVRPNPTTDQVSEGAKIAKEFGAQLVIGLGGGSAMDTAKAIAVEATHPGTAWDYNCHTAGPGPETLPIIAIGTTAGTGSQVTPCAVITKTSDQDKSAIWHPNIFPKVAIVDPDLTDSMPRSVTAQTGFDAFCHNFEAFLSKGANPMVETLALDAFSRIAAFLPRAYNDGNDREARDEMAWADTLGGLTNASGGVTLPHGLGMQVGGHAPWVSHGQALAAIYPAFTRYTRPAAVKKFAMAGRALDPTLAGVSDEEASIGCCEAIDRLLKSIDLWIGFDDLKVDDANLRAIADCGQVLGDYANNPRVATIEEMYDLLISCKKR